MRSHPIQQASDTRRPSIKDMSVDHRRFDIAMPQQLLNSPNVRAAFEQVLGKQEI